MQLESSSTSAEDVLQQLGIRVRAVRLELGMSRRILSEHSGVSVRYLAQLEAGEGNISITLLWRVSQALNVPLIDLLGSDRQIEEDMLLTLYRASSPSAQSAVMAQLSAAVPELQDAS